MEVVRAIIIGSGSSSSTPFISCITGNVNNAQPCKSCGDAFQHGGKSKNHRLNPSFLLELRHPHDRQLHYVVIDIGKTFRECALKLFNTNLYQKDSPRKNGPTYNPLEELHLKVRDISGVLLTHDHADACFGMDDLREFNRQDMLDRLEVQEGDQTREVLLPAGMPIAADFKTLTSVHRVFPYLFSQAQFDAIAKEEEERASNPGKEVKPSRTQEGAAVGSGWNFREKNTTWTAALQFNCFHSLEKESLLITARHKVDQSKNGTLSLPAAEAAKFTAPFHFVPIGVLHGKNYYSNAFVFRLSPSPCKGTPLFLLYVSDVSFIDHAEFGRQVRESQLQLLSETERQSYQQTIEKEGYPPVEVLVLDMLSDRPYVSHVSVGESVAIATAIGARHTYFVGMSHSLEYTETNERLRNMNVADRMEMGYDGCVVYDAQRTSSNI